MEKDKENYKNGPVSNRNITDCLCCLIFICAIVAFCAASAYGWFNGDPRKLLIGWDSDGNGCGYSDATKDYGHLYWAEPPGKNLKDAIAELDVDKALELLNTGTCVKTCPDADPKESVECKITKNMANSNNFDGCVYQIDLSYLEDWNINRDDYINKFYPGGVDAYRPGATIPFRYDTTRMYGFCLPKLDSDNVSAFSENTVKTFE